VCVAGEFNPEIAPPPLLARLAGVAEAEAPSALEARIKMVQQAVRGDFLQIVGAPGDGNGAQPR
jgi:hypothetical protein